MQSKPYKTNFMQIYAHICTSITIITYKHKLSPCTQICQSSATSKPPPSWHTIKHYIMSFNLNPLPLHSTYLCESFQIGCFHWNILLIWWLRYPHFRKPENIHILVNHLISFRCRTIPLILSLNSIASIALILVHWILHYIIDHHKNKQVGMIHHLPRQYYQTILKNDLKWLSIVSIKILNSYREINT